MEGRWEEEAAKVVFMILSVKTSRKFRVLILVNCVKSCACNTGWGIFSAVFFRLGLVRQSWYLKISESSVLDAQTKGSFWAVQMLAPGLIARPVCSEGQQHKQQ